MSSPKVVEVDEKVLVRRRPNKPSKYHVVFHNDDLTTMEFVVRVLQVVFHKDSSEASRLMLSVHHEGKAVVGTYSREVAETKVEQVREHARLEQFPLKATMEKEAP